MPRDPHLFKGEGERFRRYGRFLVDPIEKQLFIFEHDSFFQDKKFDVLYGDIHREFAPMTSVEYGNDFFQLLLIESFKSLPLQGEMAREPFEISAHMLRIEATANSKKGRPAPEGIHQDGYHFGSIHLMKRQNLVGAINQIYDLEKRLIDHTTLHEPMDSIYFNDRAIYHGVSPFDQEDTSHRGTRDMLILLYQPMSESPQKKGGAKMFLRNF